MPVRPAGRAGEPPRRAREIVGPAALLEQPPDRNRIEHAHRSAAPARQPQAPAMKGALLDRAQRADRHDRDRRSARPSRGTPLSEAGASSKRPARRNCRTMPLNAAVVPWARPISLSCPAASQKSSSGQRSGQCASRQRSAKPHLDDIDLDGAGADHRAAQDVDRQADDDPLVTRQGIGHRSVKITGLHPNDGFGVHALGMGRPIAVARTPGGVTAIGRAGVARAVTPPGVVRHRHSADPR